MEVSLGIGIRAAPPVDIAGKRGTRQAGGIARPPVARRSAVREAGEPSLFAPVPFPRVGTSDRFR
jgi:hypothetical protein